MGLRVARLKIGWIGKCTDQILHLRVQGDAQRIERGIFERRERRRRSIVGDDRLASVGVQLDTERNKRPCSDVCNFRSYQRIADQVQRTFAQSPRKKQYVAEMKGSPRLPS